MAEQITIMHGATETVFDLADNVYVVSSADIARHLADIDGYSEDYPDIVVQEGYTITPELAQVIYEVVRNYHEKGELPVIRYDLHN
jgi:hypothetical protein